MDKLKQELNDIIQKRNQSITNQSKRTLCYFASEVIGVVDDLLEVGGIYELNPELAPLVCTNILDYAKDFIDPDNDYYYNQGCEKSAYFSFNEKVTAKYKRKTSQKQEKRLAKKLGGRVQPGSGSLLSFKGDVITDDFLIEAKFTDKEDYRLQLAIWHKITKEAHSKDKIPLMEVCLDQDKKPVNLIIVNPMDFYDITGIDEDKFLEVFYSLPLTSISNSVKLDGKLIKEHIEYVNYNVADKMPAFLFQINNMLLFGIEMENFLKVRQ